MWSPKVSSCCRWGQQPTACCAHGIKDMCSNMTFKTAHQRLNARQCTHAVAGSLVYVQVHSRQPA